MNNREAIYLAVAGTLARQPYILQRKETVLTVLTAVVWIGTTILEHVTAAPDWLAVVVGSVTSLAAALTIALTRGGIPPSATGRILESYDMEIGKKVGMSEGPAEESGAPGAEVVSAPAGTEPARSPRPRFSLYE